MEESLTNKPGFVYILQSLRNSRYYIGSTLGIEKRFSEHQNGYVKSTRNIRPLELKFYKKYEDIEDARRIEYKLKKLKNRNIIEKIILEKDIKITI
jgi:putative endonuclease